MTGTIKITQMANAGVLDGTEVVPIIMGGFSKQCTTLQIADLVGAVGATLTVGVTPITGGTTTRIIYDNAGTVGEYAISGSGSVAMTTNPSFTTPALGTPSAGVLTNCTGLPLNTGVTGNLPVSNLNSGSGASVSTFWRGDGTWAAAGVGSVTSVAQTFTGGLISVGGSPITTSGTLALTVAGTSGGIPYFSGASTWASSAALASTSLIVGGGSGNPPTTSANLTWVSPALTIGAQQATQGQIVLANTAAGAFQTTIQASNSASVAWTLTLPTTAGTNGYALTTNGSGVTAWTAISTAPGGSTTQVQYNNAGVFAGASGLTTNGTDLTLGSASQLLWSTDLILTRGAAATLQLGAADAASPVAQTLQVQSVVGGTSNTAAVEWIHNLSAGTGTGIGGKWVIRGAVTGSSGTSQNTRARTLDIVPGASTTAGGALRLFNSYTDASNGEWGTLDWSTTTNVLSIGTAKNGTGTTRNLQFVVGGTAVADYGVTNSGRFTFPSAPAVWNLYIYNNAGSLGVASFDNSNLSFGSAMGIAFWSATSVGSGTQDIRLTRQAAGVLKMSSGASTQAGSILFDPKTYANLPASPAHGMVAAITDCNTSTWGATAAGGGSTKALVYYNGTNWTVMGI